MGSHHISSEIAHVVNIATMWCRGQGLALSRPGTGLARLEDAFFVPLDDEARQAFADGVGGELAKMHSLRSSAALAYNVFAAWREDPMPIASYLGGSGSYTRTRYEAQFPTGVSSRHPHLDVVIDNSDDTSITPVAVESKFVEIYEERKRVSFSRRYLEAESLWAGMPNVRRVGELLAANPGEFSPLEAPQLVKHILGLARRYGPKGFHLVYLWYDFASETAARHRAETDRFTSLIASDVSFRALTHQELLAGLAQLREPVPGYIRYLSGRYGLR